MEDSSRKSSKIDLFHQLQNNYDLQRLERARNRGLKRLINPENEESEDMGSTNHHNIATTTSSSSSSIETPSAVSSLQLNNRTTNITTKDSGKKKTKKSRAKQKKKTPPPPIIDPVMLDLVPNGAPTFVFKRPNGSEVVFLASSLADYLLATGDFADPESRLPFSHDDLAALDAVVVKHKLGKESVLKAKLDPHRFNDLRFRRDALSGLERCAGEVVVEMSEVVETGDLDQGQMILAMSLFPSFEDLYKQLHVADPEFARMCMDHFVTFLQGPPNRRAVDSSGLLELILSFLSRVRSN